MNQLHQFQLMFADHHLAAYTVYAMRSMGLPFVRAKIVTLVLHQIVDQNVPLTPNVHKIKRAINIDARILVMEPVELMPVGFRSTNS